MLLLESPEVIATRKGTKVANKKIYSSYEGTLYNISRAGKKTILKKEKKESKQTTRLLIEAKKPKELPEPEFPELIHTRSNQNENFPVLDFNILENPFKKIMDKVVKFLIG